MSRVAVTQPLSALLLHWAHDNLAILSGLIALAVGFIIGRYRASHLSGYQNWSESLVAQALQAHFGPPSYHLMNHITLPLEDGTTEVDHILVSRFGIFVIETKHYKGWIFADARQPKWTQVLFKYKFRFQNPIFQNDRHVRAVRERIDFLPPGAIKSIVVFTGQAEFKTEIPPGVVRISDLIEHVRGHTIPVMSLNRMQFCVGRLETTRLAISGETDVEHARSLERRHGSST